MKASPLILIVVLALAACGAPSPELSAQQSAERYLAAQGQGDWETFCSLLVAEDQQTIYRGVHKLSKKGSDCASSLNLAPINLQAQLSETTKGVEITEVQVDGKRGLLKARSPQGTNSIPMIEVDGQWKINISGSDN